jgi:hypothetical protein
LECLQVASDRSLEAMFAQVLALPSKSKVPSR